MNDEKLYSIIEQLLKNATGLEVFTQIPVNQSPPYLHVHLSPLNCNYIPLKKTKCKINIFIESRYNGEHEIKEIYQNIIKDLEGASLIHNHQSYGLVKFEMGKINLEKDNITRKANLEFTALIYLNF